MLPEGWASLVALLDGRPDSDPLTRAERLCGLCVETTGVTGVALGITGDGGRATVWATDDVSERLEELQFTFSEGPSSEASEKGWPVLVPDLSTEPQRRWPWFAPAAVEAGARATFAFPLQVGVIQLGVFALYRSTRGALTAEQHRDAGALAEAASVLLTLDQPGEQTAAAFLWVLSDRSRFRAEVHQAVGVTMVHLGVNARDAFARICAHAYSTGRPIGLVAVDILDKRLRLRPG